MLATQCAAKVLLKQQSGLCHAAPVRARRNDHGMRTTRASVQRPNGSTLPCSLLWIRIVYVRAWQFVPC